jgi:hypothetical protein
VAQNNAVAVVTGGTANLTPTAGQIPLADAQAKINKGWITTTNLVEQTDIGTAPNQIPLNQYLGNLAYQDAANIAGPVGVGGALTVVGATTLAAATMASATVTNAVEVGGGVVAEQLLVDNFTASSSAVLRGGSTNLLPFSEQFDNAAWTKGNATVTANATVAPDGTLSADKIIPNTNVAQHSVGSANIAAGTYTWSAYFKSAGYTKAAISCFDGTYKAATIYDLSNGTIVKSANGSTSTITFVGNGWYRCTVTATLAAGSNFGGAQYRPNINGNEASESVAGNGTDGVFLWGAQLNTGTTPAAYLQTVATAVTTAYAAPIESPNGLAFPLLATMTPARNADMTFELASDTSLVVKVRGSDGTVRSATLTLA